MISNFKEFIEWLDWNKKLWNQNKWYKYDDIGVVSGGFDPLHKGHVEYIIDASKRCNHLVVIVNGDSFLKRKKGYSFMTADERAYIIDNIKGVDTVIIYDSESDTVDKPIEMIKPKYFFKGGDRTSKDNIPEWDTCEKTGTIVVTGVGGDKVQSSSELVKKVR